MTIRTTSSLALLLGLLILSGCHGRRSTPGDVSPDDGSSGAASRDDSNQGRISEADLATLKANFRRINFAFDSANLDEEARGLLQQNAKILNDHRRVFVRIEGHTDTFGSDEYNLALGQRRAEMVRKYLTDLGVNEGQVTLISFGKEKTIVAAGTKDQEAPNRRAEFAVVTGGDDAASSDDPELKLTVTSDAT